MPPAPSITGLTLLLAIAPGVVHSPLIAQPTLREKIGQMIMLTFTGDSLEKQSPSIDSIKADIANKHVGGVIFFTWSNNLKSPAQIRHLTESLQSLTETPLLIATDQEGGYVARLSASNGFAATPTAFTLGTTVNTEANTRSVASMMAGWFEQTGINMNLAPVVDVNVNPTSPAIGAHERSYSASAPIVVQHAGWFIDEFRKKSILTTLKHFPGHGSAVGDSHLGFTDVTATWTPDELVPYDALIRSGVVSAVMTAHVFNAAFDTSRPATLSHPTVTGLLRDSLGYDGVLVSDAMSMGAITSGFGFEQSVRLAVNAGVDILLYTRNLEPDGTSLARKLVDLIESDVSAGEISPERIDQSYARILRLKESLLTSSPVAGSPPVPEVFRIGSYPNPFNGITAVSVDIPDPGRLRVTVYDLLGREVESLFDDNVRPGKQTLYWSPVSAASGVYLIRAAIGTRTAVQRVAYLR